MKFKSDIEVQAGLKDSSGAIGSSGQVLSSTGSNVSWVNPSASASGTVNYVSKFTGTTTLGNSLIYDNGTNVGIGTTSPAAKLDVSVGQEVNGYSLAGYPFLKYSSGDVLDYGAFGSTWQALRFLTNGSERVRVTSTGNVGIGTSSPSTLLHLYKTSFPVLTIGSGAITANIGIDTSNSILNIGTETNHSFKFSTNNTERMRIDSDGNVGIGTSGPAYRLDIADSTIDGFNFKVGNTYYNRGVKIGTHSSNVAAIQGIINNTGVYANLLLNPDGGNVGIGTSSPSTLLHLYKTSFPVLTIGSGAITANIGIDTSNSILNIGTETNHSFKFSTNNTERMRISAGGNVGIGTTSPTNPLHILKAANSFILDGLKVDRDPSTTSSAIFNAFGGATNIVSNSGATSTFSPITFRSSDNTTTNELMRITGAGLVGIGTSSPNDKLEVAGALNIQGTNSGATVPALGVNAGRFKLLNGNVYGVVADVLTDGNTYFQSKRIDGNTTAYNLLFNPLGGNIGIGTTSPTYTFDVNGTSNISGSLYASGNVGIGTTMPTTQLDVVNTMSNPTLRLAYVPMSGYGGGGNIDFVGGSFDYVNGAISWKNGLTVQGQIDYTGVNRAMTLTAQSTIVFKTTIMERMRIDSTGQVGIGTSIPMYTLHVNGSVAGVGAYVNLSDERYKKDILPIENALDKVLSLNGVTFNWDKQFNPGTKLDDANHIGLIAQEVEKVIPQAVSTGKDGNKTKSVAYTDLVPVLIEAIKELKLEIEDLKKLINK